MYITIGRSIPCLQTYGVRALRLWTKSQLATDRISSRHPVSPSGRALGTCTRVRQDNSLFLSLAKGFSILVLLSIVFTLG